MARKPRELESTDAAERFGALERGKPAATPHAIPPGAVLLEQQHRLAARPGPRGTARRLDLEQRDEAVHLRLGGRKLCEHARELQRVVAERRP